MVEKRYAIRTERGHVRMADGVELSFLIERPDAEGTFPCLLSYTPYRKQRSGAESFSYGSFAAFGYAIVTYDVRGTGDSSGFSASVYSDEERADGVFMVEWCARQSWCDGQVGMWGISYGAVVSLQMAAAAPPSLKAIIARSGTDDPFAEWTNPGGSPRNYIFEMYAPFMTARNFIPPDPDEWGDRWEAVWQERLEHSVPWGVSFLENLADGPFWRDRAAREKLDRITCPVFVVDGWADWYPTPMLEIFRALKGPKRALMGPWSHQWPHVAMPGPRIDWEHEAMRWWDYWLKGVQNGIMDDPPVTLFVRGYSEPKNIRLMEAGDFRCARSWPPSNDVSRLYLGAASRLSQDASGATADGRESLSYDPSVGVHAGKHGGGPFKFNVLMPPDQRLATGQALTFVGDVRQEPLEVIGRPKVNLHLSATAPVAHVAISLCDVAPDGAMLQITRGFQNLAYRAGAKAPPAPLAENEVYEISFELLACAYRLEPGHRIAILVTAADFLNMWPAPQLYTLTLHYGALHPSSIDLPVAPAGLMTPASHLRVLSGDAVTGMPPVKFIVGQDLVNRTAVYEFEDKELFGNQGRFEVSLTDPAQASAVTQTSYAVNFGSRRFFAVARCTTASDRTQFHHTVELSISMDDKPYWNKGWSVSAPRLLF